MDAQSFVAAPKVNNHSRRADASRYGQSAKSPVIARMLAAQQEAAAKAAAAPVPVQVQPAVPVVVEAKLTLLGRIKARFMAGVRRLSPGHRNKKHQQQQQPPQPQCFPAPKYVAPVPVPVPVPAPVSPAPSYSPEPSLARFPSDTSDDGTRCNVDSAYILSGNMAAFAPSSSLASPPSVESQQQQQLLCPPPKILAQASLRSLGLAYSDAAESSSSGVGSVMGTDRSDDSTSAMSSRATDEGVEEEAEEEVPAVDQDRRDSGVGQEEINLLRVALGNQVSLGGNPAVPEPAPVQVVVPRVVTPVLPPFMASTPYNPAEFNESVVATVAALDALAARFPVFLEDAAREAQLLVKEVIPSGQPSDLYLYHRFNKAARPTPRSLHGELFVSRPLALFRGLAPHFQANGARVSAEQQAKFTELVTKAAEALPQAHVATRLGVLDVVAARRPEYAGAALVLGLIFLHAIGDLRATMGALNELWWSPGVTRNFDVFHMGNPNAPFTPLSAEEMAAAVAQPL
ncbi:hypothetical protein H9P43_004205 [Blastocladiella emersonii ATCC 22665]|nr:hypothetical protein H9P43_004205 [Blastocladiella emersonii ATCC 22665]